MRQRHAKELRLGTYLRGDTRPRRSPPGMVAADEYAVHTAVDAGITKEDIRVLSRVACTRE